MNPLRVLWLSPSLRSLARVQAEALRRRGVDVLLVTSDQDKDPDAARDYELVLEAGFRSDFPAWLAAEQRVRAYRPHVVLAELVRDPWWIALAGSVPCVQLVHDAAEERPARERAAFDRPAATVTFSDYVATAVAARPDVRGTPVHVIPRTSDLDAALVPPLVGADRRHDFVLIGRLDSYKNIERVLEAWERHVTGRDWRGDDLVLIGAGQLVLRSLPTFVRWVPGSYRNSDVIPTLAAAKGSIAHYRVASQSGVQVLSMQLGVMPIVSTVGGLPEYQPPGFPPIEVEDVAGLTTAFDDLADPFNATLLGAAAARHYAQGFDVDCAADRLLAVIGEVLATRAPGRSSAN